MSDGATIQLGETTFGDLLRRLRTEAGLTQEELAEAAGLSVRGISDLERGINRHPYRATVLALSKALNLAPAGAADLERLSGRRMAAPSTPTKRRLPASPNPLVGRRDQIERLLRLIRTEGARLVTLTGPGGVGKTRLALEAASLVQSDFLEGCVVVSLGTISDPRLVPTAIGEEAGIPPSRGQAMIDGLVVGIGDRELLVVMDNFEHVLAAAESVGRLLSECPRLKVLATSREPLRLRSEHQLAVRPLSLPPAGMALGPDERGEFAAISLFEERAQAVNGDFELNDTNIDAVVEICRRMDGLPLALELMAAQTKFQSPDTLLRDLNAHEQHSGGGFRDLPARQQSLTAAIEWSYRLLADDQASLFRMLSIFAGPVDVEAIRGVTQLCGRDVQTLSTHLAALVDKSLLVMDPRAEGARYRMLETIREFGRAKLTNYKESDDVSQAHTRQIVELCERAAPELTGPQQSVWHTTLAERKDDIRAALERCVRNRDAESGLRIVAAVWRHWFTISAVEEGGRWAEALLALDPAEGGVRALRARGLFAAAAMAYGRGDLPSAQPLFSQSLAMSRELGDLEGVGLALNALGAVYKDTGEYQKGIAALEEALSIRRSLGDDFGVAASLSNLGNQYRYMGNLARAIEVYQESLEIQGRIAPENQDVILHNLGESFFLIGNYEQAREFSLRCLELGSRLERPSVVAQAHLNLGNMAIEQGNLAEAEQHYAEMLRAFETADDRSGIAIGLANQANLQRAKGDYDRAVTTATKALGMKREIGDRRGEAYAQLYLSDAKRELGLLSEAAFHMSENLRLMSQVRSLTSVSESLEHAGWLAVCAGRSREGVTLMAAAQCLREAVGAPLTPAEQVQRDSWKNAASSALSRSELESAENLGRQMKWEEAGRFAAETLNKIR